MAAENDPALDRLSGGARGGPAVGHGLEAQPALDLPNAIYCRHNVD